MTESCDHGVVIRRARPADAAWVRNLQAGHRKPLAADSLLALCARTPATRSFVAEVGGRRAGYLLAWASPAVRLVDVAVAPGARGRGVAMMMMLRAVPAGGRAVCVAPDTATEAHLMLRSLGFRCGGVLRGAWVAARRPTDAYQFFREGDPQP